MTLQGSINRGKKWAIVREQHKNLNHKKEIEWMDGQENIVKAISDYENSLKPVEKKPVEKTIEQMNKIELIDVLNKKELVYSDEQTKAELIEIIKGAK